jgi:hypothetical protein
MREQRVYLYRKAGRHVWISELWLGDGRRKVWGTGQRDRVAAEAAAWQRLGELLGPGEQPVMPLAAPRPAPCPPDVPAPASAGAEAAAQEAPISLQGAGRATPAEGTHGGWLERFDAWFFRELKQVFQLR